MTFEEALALLEITPQSSPDEAKRAYLRQVKRHGPERDPQGFQRMREAYELVRQGPSPVESAARPSARRVEEPSWRVLWERAAQAKTVDDWEAVARAYARAAEDPRLPPPPITPFDMLLRLLAAERNVDALDLFFIYCSWLEQGQADPPGPTGSRAIDPLFKQVWALRRDLRAGIILPLVHAILVEDLAQARPYVEAAYRRSPHTTLKAIERLTHEAPRLGQMVDPFRHELPGRRDPPTGTREAHEQQGAWWGRWSMGIGIALLTVALLLHLCGLG